MIVVYRYRVGNIRSCRTRTLPTPSRTSRKKMTCRSQRQAGRVGMRLYMGLGYRSGRWYTDDGKTVSYAWDEEAGLRGMERAVRFIEEHDGAQNGRIKGFLSPSQVDTCTEDVLRRSRQAATSLGVPLALHTSQSVNEFQEMTRRHGMTPQLVDHHQAFLAIVLYTEGRATTGPQV